MFSRDWPRWIRRAVNKHWETTLGTEQIALFIEGTNRKTSGLKEFVELRMDGPSVKYYAKDQFKIQYEVNSLIQCVIDKDLYATDRISGILLETCYLTSIPILDDSDVQVGCLQLEHTKLATLEGHDYGQIEPREKLKQASIEAVYSWEV